jgi:hypothetical protein
VHHLRSSRLTDQKEKAFASTRNLTGTRNY